MRETPEEIAELQRMFDAHLARANPHMTAIVTPERRLSAEQVVNYLQGTRIVAFATVSPKGQPRVSPLDSLFLHGRFTLSTDVKATRIAHLRANAACSAVYLEAAGSRWSPTGRWSGSPASTSTMTRSTPRGRSSTTPTPTPGATSSSSGSLSSSTPVRPCSSGYSATTPITPGSSRRRLGSSSCHRSTCGGTT